MSFHRWIGARACTSINQGVLNATALQKSKTEMWAIQGAATCSCEGRAKIQSSKERNRKSKRERKRNIKIEVKHIEKGGRSQNWPSSCKRFPSQAAKIGFLGPKLNRQNTAKAHDRFDPTEINEVDPRQQAENWIAT